MERSYSFRRRRRQKSFPKKCKEVCRKFIAFMFSNVGIIGLVVGYATLGAIIFMEIEGNHPTNTFDVMSFRQATALELWNITLTANPLKNNYDNEEEVLWRNLTGELLKTYQEELVSRIKAGTMLSEAQDKNLRWSFPEAFLYSLTVITTIGYGNVFPRTIAGKIVTIVYAIIGMPLFLLYLSNIGDIMARSFKWIYAKFCLCKCCPGVSRKRAEREKQRQEQLSMLHLGQDGSQMSAETWQMENGDFPDNSEDADDMQSEGVTELTDISYDSQAISVPVTVSLMIMVGYICSGAFLFSKYEDWGFLDGSYFCFISLSTIGFGDLVPGDSMGNIDEEPGEVKLFDLSFIFCSMYLMLGMALIAMCFNLMQEEVINKIRSTVRSVKYMCRCNR